MGNGTALYCCTSYTASPCDAASVNAFGEYIAAGMKRKLVPPHGAFLDSSYRHCSIGCSAYDLSVVIDGVSAGQAVAEWYAQGSGAMGNRGFFDGEASFPCTACCAGA